MKTLKKIAIDIDECRDDNIDTLVRKLDLDDHEGALRLDTRFYPKQGVAEYLLFDKEDKACGWAVINEVYDSVPVLKFMDSISRNFHVKKADFREYKLNFYEKL